MKLLEFAQLANNTLGAADSARSLVTRPQGNGAVAALSQQIDNVSAALSSEIRGTRDVLQRDIGTVTSMVSQVSAQQVVLRQEIHQVIEGVSSLNVLMKKHMHIVEDQLRFLIDEPLQNACYQLTAHLTNKEGVGATDEEIRAWLRILELWISKAGMQKTMTMSSEDAVRLFTQSSDNIGFIASRLHLLFGDIIPEKFLSLPPVSIKFYFTVITLYLKELEKNPHLLGADKADSICLEIQNTLNVYLEFSNFVKQHAELIQALFDRYDYCRDQLGMVLAHSSPEGYISPLSIPLVRYIPTATPETRQKLNEALDRIEEIRLLLCFIAKCVDGDTPHELTRRVLALESKEVILNHQPKMGDYESLTLGCEVKPTPKEQTRLFIHLGRGLIVENAFWIHAHTLRKQYMQKNPTYYFPSKAPDGTPSHYLQETIDALLLHLIQEPVDVAKKSFLLSFVRSRSRLLESGFNRNMIHYKRHADVTDSFPMRKSSRFGVQCNDGTPYTYSMLILYGMLGCNLFFHHYIPMPTEDDAFLSDVKNPSGLLARDKLKTTFDYYQLFITGRLAKADAFLKEHSTRKNPGDWQNFVVDPYCLLFLVCIGGRWDAFDYYTARYPLPADFDFTRTVTGATLTPLMIASEHGRKDVVDALLETRNKAGIDMKSRDGKTASELACEQGFWGVAVNLNFHFLCHTDEPNALSYVASQRLQTLYNEALAHGDGVVLYEEAPSAKNELEKSLEEMRSSVTTSKTKLDKYVPAPPSAQSAPAAQAAKPLRDEETDIGEVEDVEEAARKFFDEENAKNDVKIHVGRITPFFKKPLATERRYHRTGFRIMEETDFINPQQCRLFARRLKNKLEFDVSTDEAELNGRLLVRLRHK